MIETEYILSVNVTKDDVTITNKEKIHKGEYKATKCVFTFSQDFENLTKKAIFEAEDIVVEQPIINNKCDIPPEILSSGYHQSNLRVYGYETEEENGETVVKLRYSPSYTEFPIYRGSYIPNAEGSQEITPTQFEQYTEALNQGLEDISDKIEEVDGKIIEVNNAIDQTNNLNIDVNKVGKVATVELTKKDGTTKSVNIRDGYDFEYNWNGTSLGVKTDNEEEYEYVDLKGEKGDCNFATFEIIDGRLKMNKPDSLNQLNFSLNSSNGHLEMEMSI